MMAKKLERQGEKCRIWIVTTLLAGACISVCYFHVILRIGTIVTHIFYVPIILAAVWWKRKGLLVALFSSGFLIFSHVLLRPDVAIHNDYVRALMFIVTAFVVAELSRRIAKEEEALQAANQQLRASEQQLKASNQQLRANEQRLVNEITQRKRAVETLMKCEQRFRSLVEATSDWVWEVDQNGIYTYSSPKVKELLGYEPGELIGKTPFNLMPTDEAERVGTIFRDIVASQKPFERLENVNLHKDGRLIVLETNGVPIFDASGGFVGYRGIDRDITERKKAEEQIRKLSFAVEQSIDGIAVGDLEPKLVYVNDAFARMHGYTPEDMIGMAATKLHNKLQMQEHRRHIKQLKTQGSWEGEIGRIRKDGTAFLTYTSVTSLKNGEGKPTGTLAVVRDITESKRREEELNAYKENMVRAEELAAVGTLSATMAHELTQPLTVIRLSIENSLAELETTSCPDTVVEDLKEGLSEISSMTSMVNRFRHFARMSTKRTISEVDFKAVTERIVNLLDESAWRAKVTLQVEGMDKLPLIYSYERDLEQLFFSLIENAIQAAEGKKNRQVIISGAIRGEHIELQFSDNCGGIAPENLDRIFEPFFTTKHADERTGLGLCVVERIVSQIGGNIRIESKLGKGSTFFITLPINRGEK